MDKKKRYVNYPANKVNNNYHMWVSRLTQLAANAFQYSNLPSNLPAIEIERRLIFQGFAPVFKHDIYGLVTSWGSTNGISIYGYGTHVTYAQPILGSGELEIGHRVAVIYNSMLDVNGDVSVNRLLWYSKMLADIDSSINIAVVNNRDINSVTALTTPAYNALRDYHRKLESGDFDFVTTNSGVLESLSDLHKNKNEGISLTELYDTKRKILEDFYTDYGIQKISHKNERLIPDEIVNDEEFLSDNIRDLFEQRKLGCQRINALFGTNITVQLAGGLK